MVYVLQLLRSDQLLGRYFVRGVGTKLVVTKCVGIKLLRAGQTTGVRIKDTPSKVQKFQPGIIFKSIFSQTLSNLKNIDKKYMLLNKSDTQICTV